MGVDLLKAFNSFTKRAANFWELFGTKNKKRNSGNNRKLRHTKPKQRVATEPFSWTVIGPGFDPQTQTHGSDEGIGAALTEK